MPDRKPERSEKSSSLDTVSIPDGGVAFMPLSFFSIAQLTCLPSNPEERFLLTPLREFRGRVSFGENSIEFSIEVST